MTLGVSEAVHEVRLFEDLRAMSAAAADHVSQVALDAVRTHGRFAIALSGGNTPRPLYALLAKEPHASRIPWDVVHVFWGDERCVPLDRPDNHYTMASDLFLSKVPIPDANIHRMRGEASDPKDAAREYESELHSFFGPEKADFPRFDLVLLGLGDDGHTASLYPGAEGLKKFSRLVVAHYVPQRSQYRITLTYPVINNARQICFLVVGKEKSQALRSVLRLETAEPMVPAHGIKPIDGKIVWFVDQGAVSLIRGDVDHPFEQRR